MRKIVVRRQMLFCLYQDTKDFTAQINIIDQLDLALELRTGVTEASGARLASFKMNFR